MKRNEIYYGIIGSGHIGNYHAQQIQKISGVILKGIYDILPEQAERVAATNNTKAYKELAPLLDVCDAVTIATPAHSHFQIAIQALQSNCHVFIEKPITDSLNDAIELSLIAEKYNKIIQVGHIERFNRTFRESLKYIKKPQFIEIHRISPFPNRSLDIPVVMDVMIHDLDILLSINKQNPIKKIDATMTRGIPIARRVASNNKSIPIMPIINSVGKTNIFPNKEICCFNKTPFR